MIELRQYTLRPGRRDELIDLFHRELLEPQQQAGMTILATYRDLDDPDRFVWLRGFRDMSTRLKALTTFYNGPVWAKHGPQANATMLDSSNARLLRPLSQALPLQPSPYVTIKITPGLTNTPNALVTLPEANDFPRLPIRTDKVTVTITPHATAPPTAPATLRLTPTP
ncbi:NIPSNAP family protein [Actinomadura fulvescens]|uniref:NIPSNAP family protein n=1 Tax=Actinomadura fulvescens TaxID=46160 RepID=A0ABN3PT16_9ACTN